jgi:tryptophan synthase alpha subunit
VADAVVIGTRLVQILEDRDARQCAEAARAFMAEIRAGAGRHLTMEVPA